MKNRIVKALISAVFLLAIVISCQKDLPKAQDDRKADIMKARTWYESNYSTIRILNIADFTKGNMKIKPYWESASSVEHAGFKTVEVPIRTLGRFGFATKESEQAYKETGDERFIQSQTRLVILSKESEGKTKGFFMTIIPDKDYLEASGYKAFSSSYKNWQNSFSGYVIYYDLNGSFSNGWKLLNGKVIKTVTQQINAAIDIKKESESKSIVSELWCYDTYLLIWYQDCIEWYTNGVYTNTTCGPGYLEMELAYTICEYVEGGGGGGGGEGGYLPPDENRPCEGDPMKNVTIAPTTLNGDRETGMFGCVREGTDAVCDSLKKYHNGVDVACEPGTPVYAMKGGTVIALCNTVLPNEAGDPSNLLGNYVEVRYTNVNQSTTDIIYGHLNYVYVSLYETILAGQIIGLSGKTGNASNVPNAHTHIIVYQDNIISDPAFYFASYISPSGAVVSPCIPE